MQPPFGLGSINHWLKGRAWSATFSKHRQGLVGAPDKITFRPTLLKESLAYQWALRRDNRETHENLSPEEAGRRIRELLESTFERMHVFTTEADFAVRVGPDGAVTARQSRPTKTATPLEHNRSKTYLIRENVPCPFLAEIGVMTAAGKVRVEVRQVPPDQSVSRTRKRRDRAPAADRRIEDCRLRLRQELSHVRPASFVDADPQAGRQHFGIRPQQRRGRHVCSPKQEVELPRSRVPRRRNRRPDNRRPDRPRRVASRVRHGHG